MAAFGVRVTQGCSTTGKKVLGRRFAGQLQSRLTCGERSFARRYSSSRTPDFGFAFDIDGVLLRSSVPIPGAAQALGYLQQQSIPFILLTNGGGQSEAERVEEISRKLGISLTESMIVQSHTPFAELVNPTPNIPRSQSKFYNTPIQKDRTVLVVGGDHGKCQEVAESYGFGSVITPGDIFAAHPEIWPFSRVFNEYYAQFARPLPRPINPESPADSLKVDAILVFNDPRDWGLDIQVIMDILLSKGGILGTYSTKNGDKGLPNDGYLQDGQPPLYFSNPDLLWPAAYHLNRLGQGGFREALEGVWRKVTNSAELTKTIIGKPHHETYEYAERKLLQHRMTLYGFRAAEMEQLKTVYMVGDNPESDIAGSNSYESAQGIHWKSLLVLTGVYHQREGRRPLHEPTAIVDNVKEAVRWALKDSYWHGDID